MTPAHAFLIALVALLAFCGYHHVRRQRALRRAILDIIRITHPRPMPFSRLCYELHTRGHLAVDSEVFWLTDRLMDARLVEHRVLGDAVGYRLTERGLDSVVRLT